MVSIDKGLKVYNAVEVINGKPTAVGWKVGKVVQRAHRVFEEHGDLLLVNFIFNLFYFNFIQDLNRDPEPCVSDTDACSSLCGQTFPLSEFSPILISTL